jgi:transposase
VEARPLRYEEGRARAAMPRPKNFQALLRGSDSRPQSSRSRCRLRQGSQRCFQRSVRRETDFPRVRYPRHRRLSGCPRHRCGGCRPPCSVGAAVEEDQGVILNPVVEYGIMPKKIRLEEHLEPEELEHRYRKAKDPVERTHYQIVWLLSEGKTTREVMDATGYSRGWVQQVAKRYNARGARGLGDRRHQNPGGSGRALLTEEHQRELSQALKEPPPDGGMWNSGKVAKWIEERTGRSGVRAQRGWEYLRKLGNSPQVPRPAHAQADPEKQEAFKKSFPSG